MIYKTKLRQHFNQAVFQYDKFANVQTYLAEKTFQNIKHSPNSILELGSGTGILTKKIWRLKPKEIDCVDLSEKMNSNLSVFFSDRSLNTYTADIEEYIPNKSYDLIISSSTFQWLNKPVEQIIRYCKYLKPNSELMISFFIENTFFEFIEIIERITGKPYQSGLNFISTEEIKNRLNREDIYFELEEEMYQEKIHSLSSHLKELKKIGANNAGENARISKSEWKEIFKEYDHKFKHIHYHICYLKVTKP